MTINKVVTNNAVFSKKGIVVNQVNNGLNEVQNFNFISLDEKRKTLALSNDLDVAGDVYFSNKVDILGDSLLHGTLEVQKNALFDKGINVGALNPSFPVNELGLNINTGDINFNSGGAFNFDSGILNIGSTGSQLGKLNVNGDLNAYGNVVIDGSSNTYDVKLNGANLSLDANSDLQVLGTVAVGTSTVQPGFQATFQNGVFMDFTSIGVSAPSGTKGLTVVNGASIDTLDISGATVINDSLTVSAHLDVSGGTVSDYISTGVNAPLGTRGLTVVNGTVSDYISTGVNAPQGEFGLTVVNGTNSDFLNVGGAAGTSGLHILNGTTTDNLTVSAVTLMGNNAAQVSSNSVNVAGGMYTDAFSVAYNGVDNVNSNYTALSNFMGSVGADKMYIGDITMAQSSQTAKLYVADGAAIDYLNIGGASDAAYGATGFAVLGGAVIDNLGVSGAFGVTGHATVHGGATIESGAAISGGAIIDYMTVHDAVIPRDSTIQSNFAGGVQSDKLVIGSGLGSGVESGDYSLEVTTGDVSISSGALDVDKKLTVNSGGAEIKSGDLNLNDGNVFADAFHTNGNTINDNSFGGQLIVGSVAGASRSDFIAGLNVSNGFTVISGDTVIGPDNSTNTFTVKDTANIDGKLNAKNSLSVTGTVDISSTLSVTGTSTFDDNVTLGRAVDLTVGGTISGQSDLRINGTTTLTNSLEAKSTVYIGSTLGVTGAANFYSAVNAHGNAHLYQELNVDGNTNLGAELYVDKKSTFNSTVGVKGAFGVTGAATMYNGATIQNGVTITSGTTSDYLIVTGASGATGLSVLNGANIDTLYVSNNTSIDGNLDLNGTLGVTGAVSLYNTLNVSKNATFIKDVNINGDLGVTGAANINNGLTVNNGANTDYLNASDYLNVGHDNNGVLAAGNKGLTVLGGTVSDNVFIGGANDEGKALNVALGASILGGTNMDTLNINSGVSNLAGYSLNVVNGVSADYLKIDGVVGGTGAMIAGGASIDYLNIGGASDAAYGATGFAVLGGAVIDNLGVSGAFGVTGLATMMGGATISAVSLASGEYSLNVTQGANLDFLNIDSSALSGVTGAIIKGGAEIDYLHVIHNAVIDGDAKINTVHIDSTLDVIGASTFKGVTNTGNVLTDSLNVNNATTLGSLVVNGASVLDAGLTVNSTNGGTVEINTSLSVCDVAQFNSEVTIGDSNSNSTLSNTMLQVFGDTNLHHNLKVYNNATIDGTLDVIGAANLHDTLVVSKASTFNDVVTVDAALNVTGIVTIDDSTTINDTLHVTDAVTFDNNLNVGADSGPNSNYINFDTTQGLTVGGNTTFQNNVTVNGNLNVVGVMNTVNSTSINIADNSILLAKENNGDVLETGIEIQYVSNDPNASLGTKYAGVKRRPTDVNGNGGEFIFYKDSQTKIGEVRENSDIDTYAVVIADSFNSMSDRNLKNQIVELDGALDKIDNLRGVYHHWIPENLPQERQIGVIAQEVQDIFPELVNLGSNGFLSVNYPKLTAVLLQSLKELKAKVLNIEQRLEKNL